MARARGVVRHYASVRECARAYGQRARAGPHSESRVLARVTHAGTEICGWPRDSEIGNLLGVPKVRIAAEHDPALVSLKFKLLPQRSTGTAPGESFPGPAAGPPRWAGFNVRLPFNFKLRGPGLSLGPNQALRLHVAHGGHWHTCGRIVAPASGGLGGSSAHCQPERQRPCQCAWTVTATDSLACGLRSESRRRLRESGTSIA